MSKLIENFKNKTDEGCGAAIAFLVIFLIIFVITLVAIVWGATDQYIWGICGVSCLIWIICAICFSFFCAGKGGEDEDEDEGEDEDEDEDSVNGEN
mgnify:CR=1 FL=1